MGSVYEAADEQTGTRVAVKILHAEVLKDASSKDDTSKLSRFQREAKASSSVQSEHIARMLDWGSDESTVQPFMVMELLHGEDMQAVLKRSPVLPPEMVLRIGAQACKGLVKAHEARVMHRDIKPANLFFARSDSGDITVKLLDFGIAKFRPGPDGGEEIGETTNLTRTGSMLGSPRYMSPEQARGSRTLDHRTDLWSLGVVMYRALTGHMPHEDAEAMGDFIVLLCSEPPRSIHKHAPWVPAEVVEVVEGALQIDREKRYATAQVMLDAILALLPAGDRFTVADVKPLPDAVRLSVAPPRPEPKSGASSTDATVPLPTARVRALSGAEEGSNRRRDDNGTPSALASTHTDTHEAAVEKPRRAVTPFVIGAAVLVLGLGGFAVLRGSDLGSDGSETAPTGSAQPVPTPGPSLRRASLVVVPGDVAVEIDGQKAQPQDGVVEIAGALGSVHHVKVARDGQEKLVDVVLGENGAEPPKVELTPAAALTTTTATTSATPGTTGPRPPPTTKKTASPSVSSAPTPGKTPLIPEKFE